MKKYNCIVVFDQRKQRCLFCKRTKAPYQGKYNFVGGKAERGEDSFQAAYRELQEETGIGKKDITLFHLMDFTYYHLEMVLEIYLGQLHGEVPLTEEINPLVWFSMDEDFTDPDKFAGEQNIAHIINMACQYPLEEAGNQQEALTAARRHSISDDILCIGVDGCRGGWIAAIMSYGTWQVVKYESLQEITRDYPRADAFLIDIPVGLADSKGQLRPDAAARKLLPGRASTIFSVPCRQAVYEDTRAGQDAVNRSVLGKGVGAQTSAIVPKIKEMDVFLKEHACYKNVITESHPELCFARLNGAVMLSRKKEEEGIRERIRLLKQFLPDLNAADVSGWARQYRCMQDDIVDAVCLCVAANLHAQGKSEMIPGAPMEDSEGILLRMAVPSLISAGQVPS